VIYLLGWCALGWLVCELGHIRADRKRMPYEFKKNGLTVRSSDAGFIARMKEQFSDGN